MVPLAGLPPMTAKRVWLSLSLLFLAAAIWILARLTNLPVPGLIVLALLGHNAMAGNFELGQYYCFLLFLMTVSVWLLLGGREFSAGLLLGAIFILKLYAGPFLFYFAWKRRWRPLAGMLLACLVLSLFSIAWFGWRDHLFYLTDVLPRAAAGEHMDPYNPGMPTILNMLRHPFESEPELNPNPPFNNPALVFFLQPLLTLAIPAFCLLAIPHRTPERNELAWFLIMLVLVSPSRAFYVTIILLLPIALLLEKADLRKRILLIAAYLLLNISLPDAIQPFFPTVWILFALYITLGIPYWRNLRPSIAALAAVSVIGVAAFSSYRRMDSYHREPPQKFERVAFEKQAIYSASPTVSTDGVVYESIAENRYLLKQWKQGSIVSFPFDGQAFHPSVAAARRPNLFRAGFGRPLPADGLRSGNQVAPPTGLVRIRADASLGFSERRRVGLHRARRRIAVYSFGSLGAIDGPTPVHDVAWFPSGAKMVYSAGPSGSSQIFATVSARENEQLTRDAGDHTEPAVSPDGTWLAYTLARGGTRQVWIQNLITRKATPVTEGACNSFSASLGAGFPRRDFRLRLPARHRSSGPVSRSSAFNSSARLTSSAAPPFA